MEAVKVSGDLFLVSEEIVHCNCHFISSLEPQHRSGVECISTTGGGVICACPQLGARVCLLEEELVHIDGGGELAVLAGDGSHGVQRSCRRY